MAKGLLAITLPTKAYLGKFLQSQYGNPVIFSKGDSFGMIIALCLEKKIYKDRSNEEIKLRFDSFTSIQPVYMPASWLKWNPHYSAGISRMNIIYINKLLESIFEEELYRFCKLHVRDMQRKQAIELFCTNHNIKLGWDADDDINYDCLKKMEYRYREKKEDKSILDLSPDKMNYRQTSILYTSVAC